MYRDHCSPPEFAERPQVETVLISWLKPIGIFGLSIYNFILRILTLGIHHFWGKTEVRKRIWCSVRLNGEPLEYTGTGKELFLGFLIIFGVILLPVSLATFAAVFLFGPESTALKVFQFTLYASFVFLTGMAIYRAQRYRLNRTRWRGIRAGLHGSSLSYAWTYFWTLLLIPFTLGWISPWRSTLLQKIVTDDMRFGNRPFHFSGNSGPLYKSFTVFWLLTALLAAGTFGVIGSAMADFVLLADGDRPPQLPPDKIMKIVGLVYGGLFVAGLMYMVLSAWYRAAMMRHFARHTHLDNLTFQSTVKAHGLLWISVTNYLMLFVGGIVATAAIVGIGMVVLSGLASAGIDPLGMASGASPAMVIQKASGAMTLIFVLSLGMLLPIAQSRSVGYVVRNLAFDGSIDLSMIAAGAEQDIKRGEGLAQAFDIDAL